MSIVSLEIRGHFLFTNLQKFEILLQQLFQLNNLADIRRQRAQRSAAIRSGRGRLTAQLLQTSLYVFTFLC